MCGRVRSAWYQVRTCFDSTSANLRRVDPPQLVHAPRLIAAGKASACGCACKNVCRLRPCTSSSPASLSMRRCCIIHDERGPSHACMLAACIAAAIGTAQATTTPPTHTPIAAHGWVIMVMGLPSRCSHATAPASSPGPPGKHKPTRQPACGVILVLPAPSTAPCTTHGATARCCTPSTTHPTPDLLASACHMAFALPAAGRSLALVTPRTLPDSSGSPVMTPKALPGLASEAAPSQAPAAHRPRRRLRLRHLRLGVRVAARRVLLRCAGVDRDVLALLCRRGRGLCRARERGGGEGGAGRRDQPVRGCWCGGGCAAAGD